MEIRVTSIIGWIVWNAIVAVSPKQAFKKENVEIA
jgi:hypothetical protein